MFVISSNEILPNVRQDLFLLATCYFNHCYQLAKLNRRSVTLFFFFEEGFYFRYVIVTACKKAKNLVF